MTQTFWLSFCDGDRPKGQQFLGVCIVDVTEADALEAVDIVVARRMQVGHPDPPDPEAVWIAAAVRKAHREGCNPGGDVATARIDQAPHFAQHGASYPRNRLCSKAEIEAIETSLLGEPS